MDLAVYRMACDGPDKIRDPPCVSPRDSEAMPMSLLLCSEYLWQLYHKCAYMDVRLSTISVQNLVQVIEHVPFASFISGKICVIIETSTAGQTGDHSAGMFALTITSVR